MMTMVEHMLSTADNPFDPFTQYREWWQWDYSMGYHTPGLLARIARSSDDLSDEDQEIVIDQAIDEIVRENISGVHIKVSRDSES